MGTVGIRDLKNRLGEYLRRVAAGERIIVTDRGRPLAVISPVQRRRADGAVDRMIREGLARWGGGKPRGTPRRVRIKGRPISHTVIEGRR